MKVSVEPHPLHEPLAGGTPGASVVVEPLVAGHCDFPLATMVNPGGRFLTLKLLRAMLLHGLGAGKRVEAEIEPEMEGRLSFQIDEENGTTEVDARVIWTAPAISGGQFAGLLIPDHDEIMRKAIHRLCTRGEARIDLDSLRRKFDQLRAQWPKQSVAG